MKNVEVLCWGMKHIAGNHNCEASVDYEQDGSVCIFGPYGISVPANSDVRMLCEDLSIPRDCIDVSDFGIDVYVTQEWYDTIGQQEYVYPEECRRNDFWKRSNVAIGS